MLLAAGSACVSVAELLCCLQQVSSTDTHNNIYIADIMLDPRWFMALGSILKINNMI